MTEYRVCLNTQPHFPLYWTVEKSEHGLFRTKWRPVKHHVCHGLFSVTHFRTESEARAWVAEDKKPRTHVCKPA